MLSDDGIIEEAETNTRKYLGNPNWQTFFIKEVIRLTKEQDRNRIKKMLVARYDQKKEERRKGKSRPLYEAGRLAGLMDCKFIIENWHEENRNGDSDPVTFVSDAKDGDSSGGGVRSHCDNSVHKPGTAPAKTQVSYTFPEIMKEVPSKFRTKLKKEQRKYMKLTFKACPTNKECNGCLETIDEIVDDVICQVVVMEKVKRGEKTQ